MKVKYADFTQVTCSRTVSVPFAGVKDMVDLAHVLLAGLHPFKRPVRLLGLTLSSLVVDKETDQIDKPQLGLGL